MQVRSLNREDPLEKEMATHPFSCLENPMDRGAWRAVVHGVAESDFHFQELYASNWEQDQTY